jgi:hypothetical protein
MTKEQIKDIAGNLDCGFRCYVHRDRKDIIFIPDTDQHFDMDMSEWKSEIKAIKKDVHNYVEIVGLDSRGSFQLMTDFVDTVDEVNLQEKLGQALSRPKPFWNFKFELNQSQVYRDKWFKFKEEKIIALVEGQVEAKGL